MLQPHAPFRDDLSSRPVTASGRYAVEGQLLVPDRRLDGVSGLWVLTPFVVDGSGATLPVVRGFVAAGLGVAIVPALPAEARQAGSGAERLVRLTDPGAFRDIGLAWSRNRRLLPSAELFRRHVLEGPTRSR